MESLEFIRPFLYFSVLIITGHLPLYYNILYFFQLRETLTFQVTKIMFFKLDVINYPSGNARKKSMSLWTNK